HKVASYTVNAIKGTRYKDKAEAIQKWVDKDRSTQEKYDNATPPEDIYCKDCHSLTKVISKDLLREYEEDSQVVFMFDCVKCKKRQALYEDGTEWVLEPDLCPKCSNALEHKSKYVKEVSTTTYACPKCSYKKKDVYDFKKSGKEHDKRETRERKLLAEYRDEFCYNEKDGEDFWRSMDGIKGIVDGWKEREKKEKNPDFQKAMKLNKLPVAELEKLLSKSLEKEKYIKFSLDKPEINKYVIVPFTVQEADSSRKEYDSTNKLQKLVRKTLEGTNWRLMSDGTYYRLGYVYGRLKGYEREEDLMEIVKKKV
ncbi:MAG: hypothetical protein ACUZ77_10050, partial [Candidatus Brocadiales bacterium]